MQGTKYIINGLASQFKKYIQTFVYIINNLCPNNFKRKSRNPNPHLVLHLRGDMGVYSASDRRLKVGGVNQRVLKTFISLFGDKTRNE